MRKWLVGLLAAGLCASSAWATTDTLDLAFTGVSGSYTEWSEKTGDSGAVYAGQSASGTKDNPCIQLRSNNNNSGIVTTGSGGTATKVTVVWNSETADARILDVYGKNEAYTAATDLYSKDAQGTKLGSLNKGNGDTELVIDGEYTFIGLRSNSGAMYLDSVAIEWGGEPTPVEFSIALKPAEDFEVVQNKSASITATVKGAKGDVTYSWSVDGTPIDLAGNVYAVDSAEVGGPFEVVCEADDGVSDPVSASVKYTVVEAPVVSGDVLTRDTTGVTGTSYKDWTATGDSGTVYAGNSAGGNTSIQLNTGSPKGIVITESAGSDVESVTVEWNDATVEKRSIEIYGSADAYAGPADLYGDAKGELLGTLARGETTLAVPEGYPYVGILAKGGALYLTSVAFEFAGEAGLSVTLDKANGFTVDLGTADSITATAKNGAEPYEYVWSSDTPELNATGEVLAIPDTLAAGDYTVQVEVTDAEANKASKQIGFSVVAPAVKYQVQVAIGIPNGSVSADKTEAEEGELVTLTASPATGYKLEHFLVNNVAISANTFPMPAEDVLVSASFIEKPVVAGFTKITSLDDLTEGEYVITGAGSDGEYAMKASISTGSTKFIERREEAVTIEEDTVTDAEDIIIWTLAQGANGWTIYNADVGYAGYVASGNSAGAEAEASEKSSWTIAESETDGLFLLTNVGNTGRYLLYNASSPRFACYEKTTSGKQLALYKGSSGPSIAYTGETEKTLPDGAFELVFTLKGYEGDYSWSLVEGEGTLGEGGMYTWTADEAGEYTIKVAAVNGELLIAQKVVTLKVYGPVVVSPITIGEIANGSVVASIDGEPVTVAPSGATVTLTATADSGFKFASMSVTYGDTVIPFTSATGTFEMPAEEVFVSAEFIEKPVVAGFTKIKSLDELTEGEYVITGAKAAGEEYAMKASISTGNTKFLERREEAVTLEEDVVTDAEESIIWTLAQGENGWTIYNEAVGYAGYVASGNSSGAEAEPSAKSSWTITASETAGLFLLNNVGSEGRYLLYNSGNPRFACYTNLTSGKHLALYKGSSGPVAFSIALNPAEDFEVQQGKDAAITATVRGAQGDVSYSWSVNGTPIDLAGNVYAIDSAEVGGPFTVVCEASDGVSEPVSASVSYTVVEVPPVTGDEFELISSLDDLEDGAEYVITDNNQAYAMKAELSTSSTKRLLNEPVTPDGGVITTEDASIIWKLVEDADGNFAFYNESIGKYIGWSSGNSAKLQDEAFANTISYEDDLFVVMATSTAELDKPRKLQFNSAANALQFAYYEGTQKNLNFFKKAGPSAPKIVYSGETAIALGDSFEIIFGLLNYEGDFEWVLDSREGGSIAPDGLYTWTPTEATDGVTIKVVARSGELDIASKEVQLTVTEPGPQPGEPAIVFGGDSEGVVGQVVNFTVTAVNISDPTVYLDGIDFPADSTLTADSLAEDYPNVSFTPDVAGDYVFNYSAGEGDEYAEGTLTITVTGEGPQPSDAAITKMTIAAGKMTIEFFGEGAQVFLSDDLQTWTPVDGAISPYTIDMGTGPQYIGVK